MNRLKELILGKYFRAIAFGLHLIVLLLLYSKFGINFSNESHKYISIAKELNSENYSSLMEYLTPYTTYILFLTICFKLNLAVYVILFIQYIFCMAGFYLFYKFILSQSFFPKVYARLSFLLVITCPLIVYWLLTFYTESFFISLVMICTYLAFSAKTRKNLIIAGLFLILLVFCRPVGVFYAIGLIFVVMKLHEIKYAVLFLFAALANVFVAVLFFVPLHFNDFVVPVLQGSVICGFPSYPDNLIPEGNYTLVQVYSAFLSRNSFSDLFVLFNKKAVSFFTLTRPYYSLGHNILNSVHYIFFFGIFYSFFDFFKRKERNLFISYFISVLVPSFLIVVLIYNEWSERFLTPLFPFFIVLTLFLISKRKRQIDS